MLVTQLAEEIIQGWRMYCLFKGMEN